MVEPIDYFVTRTDMRSAISAAIEDDKTKKDLLKQVEDANTAFYIALALLAASMVANTLLLYALYKLHT